MGAGSPNGQLGVQLYDWSNYLSNGAGEITCPAAPAPATVDCVQPPAPSTTNDRLARVFAYLQSHSVQNVELYGYPGNPFPGTNAATANNTAGLQALRTLGDSYGLRFVSRHGNINAGNWDNDIAASKLLGQEVIGAADPPSTSNLQNILNTAQLMNSLGKRSVEAGLGPVYFHNHAAIFANKVTDAGVVKSQWEALMDHTDPRYVMAQIDLFWMASGLNNDNAQMVSIFNKYNSRIISFHVKDGVTPNPNAGTANLRALGTGDVDFTAIFAAAKNRVRYYLYEYDPDTPGANGGFNPFTTSDTSLANLKGDPAPVAGWNVPTFASAPAGTAGTAANAVPIKVTNIGDAPLVFTNAVPTLAADADAGGNTTRDDFMIVSQDCQNKTLAPAKAAVADDPTTPANEATPAVPAGTCTVNVAFKPTRTNYTSVARLQLTSNADDATERVPLVGRSTGDAIAGVGGDVPATLALSLPAQGGSFGSFLPGIAKSYETAISASVTSTAGD